MEYIAKQKKKENAHKLTILVRQTRKNLKKKKKKKV
jgi:hypothetical protein